MTVLNAQSNGQNSVCTHALPEGWEWSTVGECFFEMTNGTTISQNRDGCGVPVSRIESIQEARFDLSRMGNVADAPAEIVERFQYRLGDIALSHINSFEHVGKTALYDGIPKVLLHGMNLLRLRLGHEHISSTYAYVFMQSDCFRQGVRDRVTHAVNQVSINQKNLSQVPFPLPPIAEQKRIAAKVEELLARVNAARERLDKVPKIMRHFRQAVLAAACSGKLTEDWRESNPNVEPAAQLLQRIMAERLKQFGRRYVDVELTNTTELPRIPDSWEWTTIDALLRDLKGLSYGILKPGEFDPDGIPMLRIMDVGEWGLNDTDVFRVSAKLADEYKRTRLETGDILLAVMATIGRAAVVPPRYAGANVNRALAVLKFSPALDPNFACTVIRSPYFQNVFALEQLGSAQPRINLGDLRQFRFPLPPADEQHEIVRRLEDLFKLADAIEKRVAAAKSRADKLPQSILAKAFRGELVPTEAELARRESRDYEPASVLLERIRAEREEPPSMKGKRQSSVGRHARLSEQ